MYPDTTVRVAKKYLEEHPNEAIKYGDLSKMKHDSSVGRSSISRFLNWPESRVSYSLERLNLEKSGMVNRQASFLLSLILRCPFHDAATGIF